MQILKKFFESHIEEDDYEAMISEEMNKLKEKYSSNIAKVGFSLLGLDLLLGW